MNQAMQTAQRRFKEAYYRVRGAYVRSYSQQGEDLLIDLALRALGITQPHYLDIGANNPMRGNNTYLRYTRGARGVLVEPDPRLASLLRQKRPGDTVIQVGIAPASESHAQYYVMSGDALSTFKREEAQHMVESGSYGPQEIRQVLSVPLISINALMAEHFPQGPDVLSLDTEGYDLEIIQALDFSRYAPRCMCIETLRYDAAGKLYKVQDIIDFAEAQGYTVFADTRVNTIFIRK